MRIRDKIFVENGYITETKIKWYGGCFAYPYLWKTNKADIDYQESWTHPRLPKENKQQKQILSQEQISKNHSLKIG